MVKSNHCAPALVGRAGLNVGRRGSLSVRAFLKHFGLVATQSIRVGSNRKVPSKILELGEIYEAWADEPWVLADAAVRRNEMSLEGQAALLVKFDLERKIGARHLEIVEQRRVPDMRDHLSDIEA